MNNLHFPEPWLEPLGKAYCEEILDEISANIAPIFERNISVFPPLMKIFRALEIVNFSDVKILILGQDPYHGLGQANGLAFSVDSKLNIPPSLQNIFRELERDLKIPISSNGDLTKWAEQGVLLLNSTLSVEEGIPNSHQTIGWSKLTDLIIKKLSDRGNVIFVLWGNFARKKQYFIDLNINNILIAPHPSPLSSYRGFFGCKHFSKINSLLAGQGDQIIDWKVD